MARVAPHQMNAEAAETPKFWATRKSPLVVAF